MTSQIPYLKGIRTRYRNFLEQEIEKATELLRYDRGGIDVEHTVHAINKCVEKLNVYSEKVETQTEKLSCVLDESEGDFLDTILGQDSQICADAMECCIDLKQMKEQLVDSKEEELDASKLATQTEPDKLAEMQSLIFTQMKQQQDFLDHQQNKIKEQEKLSALEKTSSVKLPKIDIVSYSGDRLKWNEFWDSFECTVHKNSRLSNIEKFSYLISKLSGEAARVISDLALSNENYDIAIACLKERFGNKQEVVDLHYSQIINLQAATNNTQSLRLFLDRIQRHLRSLEVLKQDINQDVFVSMVKAKLPQEVLLQLEIMNGADNEWNTVKIIEILRRYVKAREKSEVKQPPPEQNAKVLSNKPFQGNKPIQSHSKPMFHHSSKQKYEKRASPSVSSAEALVAGAKDIHVGNYLEMCRYCSKHHWSDECPTFRTLKDRKQQLKDSCYKCLRIGHLAKECKRSKVCVHCGEANSHHRSLCPKKFKQSNGVRAPQEVNVLTEQSGVLGENVLISSGEFVLMQTAKTDVKHPDTTESQNIRLLFDSGSQRTYITEHLAEQLKLKRDGHEQIKLATFGTNTPKTIKTTSTEISLKLNNGDYLNIRANIVPTISGNIQRNSVNLASDQIKHLVKSVELADSIPSESETSTIELLIGNDYYLDLILSQKVEIQPGLYLLASKLGWILTGRTTDASSDATESSMLCLTYGNSITNTECLTTVDPVVPTKPDLEDFWNVEGIGIIDRPQCSDDESAMARFHDTLKFENDRYQVTWPWKEELPDLPLNRELAVGRLKSVLSKLRNKPELLQKYDSILKEQLDKGVIETVNGTDSAAMIHYLPHHAVVKPTKTTTKLRIVYDASAKTKSTNKSLNECLYRGPVLLRDLCGILLRFRLNRIGIVADIEKAFLQIGLQPNQRDVTRFLWLKDLDNTSVNRENIQEYRFCRVPFGVISSPFLLGATVESHLDSYNCEIARRLKENIYVDNVITGMETVGDAIQFYSGAKAIFHDASLNLREWTSNSCEVNSFIPSDDRSAYQTTKVLGHLWNIENDSISLKQADIPTHEHNPTKRIVLKTIASVFDPQGLFSPVILRGKVMLQNLWSKGLDWDDEISSEDLLSWSELKSDINNVSECQIPRCVRMNTSGAIQNRLLCFCDASQNAYATLIYLHQTNGSETKVDLMFTKTRLTPVKGMTIPRAELMAVLIGVRCLEFVKQQLKIVIEGSHLWTDSQCVLKWIASDKDLTVFVANRVREINSHSNVTFSYVTTKDNPADIATRGSTLTRLCENELWWQGPQWLTQHQSDWPEGISHFNEQGKSDYESELKKHRETKETNVLSSVGSGSEDSTSMCYPFEIDSSKYSSVTTLVRVTAYVMRFIHKTRKCSQESGFLTSEELRKAENMWLCVVQRNNYAEVFQAISGKTRNNLQKQLGLYIDEEGLLRCKGRLDHSDITEGARRPVLLPGSDKFTHLLIERVHTQTLHSGVSQTLSQVRNKFWIPKGRAVVRQVIQRCLVCRRHDGGPYKMPQMAQLPPIRVTEAIPFSRTGLDYLGPLFIRGIEGPKKIWICLFTCLVIRAVHLEVVQDMTADEFLLCFRRFIAQRGLPNVIISDNAMQFKAANRSLDSIWNSVTQCEEVQNYASNIGAKWIFIVEMAPWMGGFYERLVGLVKRALRKTLAKNLLTMIQMQTLIKEVEAVLNSRPLVYVGEDINSRITLTPGNFLSLNPRIGIPETDVTESEYSPCESSGEKLLNSWKKGQKLLDKFWKMWREDYLLSLRERTESKLKSKRVQSKHSPTIGDVVLVKDEIPRGCWKLAKIVSLNSSSDGEIRSAKVQLPSGRIVGRPLNLLYPLELSEIEVDRDSQSTSSAIKMTPLDARPKRTTVEKTIQRIRQCLH